jgi:dTDP-glucose 4,6-dehydratase
MERILVTGGAGFIGSNFIQYALRERPDWTLVNLDKLTYAGNLANLAEVMHHPRHEFVQGDICDPVLTDSLCARVDAVINFAAESHVDNSIEAPLLFEETNVKGTMMLMNAARKHKVPRFLQVSTDEVYGSVLTGSSKESDRLEPRSPYSASKAGAELQARAYHETFGLPILITRSNNNYGPYQYPEKVIPLFVTNLLEGLGVPLYGKGENIRDWLHVEDNCRALALVIEKGRVGEAYNIGGGNDWRNIDLTRKILALMGKDESYIIQWPDRPGHDLRYSIDGSKLTTELGWKPGYSFEDGLQQTIDWYRQNEAWWKPLKARKFGSEAKYRETYRRRTPP